MVLLTIFSDCICATLRYGGSPIVIVGLLGTYKNIRDLDILNEEKIKETTSLFCIREK